MLDDADSVTRRLLSPGKNCLNMNSAVIENEKGVAGGNKGDRELDLRLHDAVCDPDNIEEIENLIDEEPGLLFETDNGGRVPLHAVAIDGS